MSRLGLLGFSSNGLIQLRHVGRLVWTLLGLLTLGGWISGMNFGALGLPVLDTWLTEPTRVLIVPYVALLVPAIVWGLVRFGLQERPVRQPNSQPGPDALRGEPAAIVTLVHGTWGWRSPWLEEGSPLRDSIVRAVGGPVRFERFKWSGQNSVLLRQLAQRRFADHANSIHRTWPTLPHLVVAHSHGGNVALKAMEDPSVSDSVTHIICMSTPFLVVSKRPRVSFWDSVAIFWAPAFFAYRSFAGWLSPAAEYGFQGTHIRLVAVLGATMVALALGVAATRVSRWVETASRLPRLGSDRLLVLRVVGDEPALSLNVVAVVSEIVDVLWRCGLGVFEMGGRVIEEWRSKIIRRPGMSVLAVIVMWMLGAAFLLARARPTDDAFLSPRDFLVVVSLMSLGPTALLAVLVRGGPGSLFLGPMVVSFFLGPLLVPAFILGALASPELGLACLVVRVTAELAPPGEWAVHQLERDAAGASLAHSQSYETRSALLLMEGWISAKLRTARGG